MSKRQTRDESLVADLDQAFSINGVNFSVARLVLPGTDLEATTVVGEMTLPADADGASPDRPIGIGAVIQLVGDDPEAPAAVHIGFVPGIGRKPRKRARGARPCENHKGRR